MKPIQIDIPVSDAIVPGDYAETAINGNLFARVDLLPGEVLTPSHLETAHLTEAHLAKRYVAGHLEGVHLIDPHLGQFVRTLQTNPLYFGRYDVSVQVHDSLGNPSPDAPASTSLFINTGPNPPRNLRFDSQAGAGPITFAFTPAPEVING